MLKIISDYLKRRAVCKEILKAYVIGRRAAKGKNIYLTFGSAKTQPKRADESYKRYCMAMKHYDQVPCNKEYFYRGFEDVQREEREQLREKK